MYHPVSSSIEFGENDLLRWDYPVSAVDDEYDIIVQQVQQAAAPPVTPEEDAPEKAEPAAVTDVADEKEVVVVVISDEEEEVVVVADEEHHPYRKGDCICCSWIIILVAIPYISWLTSGCNASCFDSTSISAAAFVCTTNPECVDTITAIVVGLTNLMLGIAAIMLFIVVVMSAITRCEHYCRNKRSEGRCLC